jgi:HlyD family secretion protein
VIVLALLAVVVFSRGNGKPSYITEPVARHALDISVTATGNLRPTNQVQVGSEVSGRIDRVLVDVNDRVGRGQVLAQINTDVIEDQIRQAQANVNSAHASVAQAGATLGVDSAQLARLQEVYRLSAGKVPSKTELEAAEANVKRDRASVAAAQASVASAQAQLSSAMTNRDRAVIRSPVSGVVLARQVEPGQTVAASFNTPTLFVLAEDLSSMQLRVNVDEADVGQVHPGQRATFTVDAYPGRSFAARIQRVDVGANATDAAASTTNTVVSYTAVLTVQNPDLALRPGMTATADIVTTEKKNVLLVPNAALRFSPDRGASGAPGGVTGVLIPRRPRRGGGADKQATIGRGSRQTVYLLGADNQPRAVQVVVGDSNGSQTEIVSGALKAGDAAITAKLAAGEGGGGQRKKRGGSSSALLIPAVLPWWRRRPADGRNG